MFLFKNDERIMDLAPYRPELQKAFPSFYDATNPKPVTILVPEEDKVYVVRRLGGKGAGHRTKIDPLPMSVKTIKYVSNDKGTYDMIVLSPEYPQPSPKTGRMEFKKPIIKMRSGMTLHPEKDETVLVWCYLFSGLFKNGKKRNPRGTYEFYQPEVKAKGRIEQTKIRHELEKNVLLGGDSSILVNDALVRFGFDVHMDEGVNRTALYDYLLATDSARPVYEAMRQMENTGEIADLIQLVREAMDRKKIVQKEEGGEVKGWSLVGKTGVGRPFAPVTEGDQVESLARIALADKSIKVRIEKALSDD